jgi:hypothetical protein
MGASLSVMIGPRCCELVHDAQHAALIAWDDARGENDRISARQREMRMVMLGNT